MNKMKLLMLLILAATGMTVSAADAGYEFVESDGGKTLTIKGYGDLTNCSQTSTQTVFTAAANGNIYTNDSGTGVTLQAEYNPLATYYYADRTYSQVFNGEAPSGDTYVHDVYRAFNWTEKAKSVHIYEVQVNWENKIQLYRKISTVNDTPIYDYAASTLQVAAGKASPSQFNPHYYVYSETDLNADWSTVFVPGTNCNWVNNDIVTFATTYITKVDYLYRSQDGGVTKELLLKEQPYAYSASDLFYIPNSTSYIQISSNDEFFAAHPAYLEDAEVTATFKEALLEKIKSGSYTKVVFDIDNTGSDELLIDPEIAQTILFPNVNGYYTKNTNIETLDMGEATLKLSEGQSFTDIVSKPNDMNALCNLSNFTIPMMPKDENGEMVLPNWALTAKFPGDSNLETLTVPVGYTELGEGSLALNANITTINMPKGLKKIDAQVFSTNTSLSNFNITGAPVEGRSIVLPSTLEEIGKEAFASTAIASTEDDPFILPASLKKIGTGAFFELTNLKFLQLNEGLEYVGNSAFGLTSKISDQTAITFPSTIKYLGPGSFVQRWYQDIYFTSEKAPVCPVGQGVYPNSWGDHVTAFSNEIHMGNNGFNPNGAYNGSTADDTSEGYANRENYVNGGTNNEDGGYYFTELHYPTGTSAENEMTYKDITRRYVTGKWDGSGGFSYSGYGSAATFAHEIDPDTNEKYGAAFLETTTLSYGNYTNYCTSTNLQPGFIDTYQGKQTVWPSQAQWMRYYITVANGLSWDGVTAYRPEVTEEMFNMMKEDGLVVNQDNDEAGINLENIDSFNDLNTDQKNYLSKILYQGTRRFVLGNDSPYEIPFKMEMEAGRWWSICLPFNMTKKQINEVFGVGTHVCLFSGVKRTDGNDKLLRLEFINDVYHHKTVRTVEKLGDGSALKYTYGANYSTSNPEPADDEIVIYARESYMIYPTKENDDASEKAIRNFGTPDFAVGDPLPTMIQANSKTPYTIDGKDVAYRFIGNFTTNASYDAKTNMLVPVKIPRYSYAYGQSGGVTKFFILNSDKAVWTPFKSIVQNLGHDFGLSDWENFFQKSPAGAKQVSVFGLDEYLTGVENVIIEVSSDNGADKAVYSINGSYVGDSLQGLAPGVYVKQGKAYIVK